MSAMNGAGVNQVGVNPVGVNPTIGVNPVGVNQVGVNPVGVNPIRMNKGVSALLQTKLVRKKPSKESKSQATIYLLLAIILLIVVLILHIIVSSSYYWRFLLDKDSVLRRDGVWGSCVKTTQVRVNGECKSVWKAKALFKTIQATDVLTYLFLIAALISNISALSFACTGQKHLTPAKMAIVCHGLAVLVQVILIVCFVIDSSNVPDSIAYSFRWGFYVEIVAFILELISIVLIKLHVSTIEEDILEEELERKKNLKRRKLEGVQSVIALQQFQPTDGLPVQQTPMMQPRNGQPVQPIPMMQPTDGQPVQQIPMQPSNSVPMYPMF